MQAMETANTIESGGRYRRLRRRGSGDGAGVRENGARASVCSPEAEIGWKPRAKRLRRRGGRVW